MLLMCIFFFIFVMLKHRNDFNNRKRILWAHLAQEFGFVYQNRLQELSEGMKIYPGDVFLPSCNPSKTKPFAIHVTNGSWRPFLQKLTRLLKHLPRRSIESRLRDYENKPAITL